MISQNRLLIIAISSLLIQLPLSGKDSVVEPPKNDESANSKLQFPSQKMLNGLLDKLKSVRIIDCGMDEKGNLFSGGLNEALEEPFSGKVLFESSDPKVLMELKRLLRLKDSSESPAAWHAGTPTFELTLDDGNVANIGLCGNAIRWKVWRYDAFLLNPSALLIWLSEHGVRGPLRVVEEQRKYERQKDKERRASFEEFVRLMPKSMLLFLGTMNTGECYSIEELSKKYANIPKSRRLELAREALRKQFPSESEQIAALLKWGGEITNFRLSFQAFPIELLLDYEPKQVLIVANQSSMSPAQWVGLSRYYSDLNFRRKFPSGYRLLSKKLRERIVNEVKLTGENELDVDEFKRALKNWCQP